MSETNDSPNTGDDTVSIDHVTKAVESYRSQTKRREYQLPNPEGDDPIEIWFEYGMLSEAEREEMQKISKSVKPTRTGQSDGVEIKVAEARLYTIKQGVEDTNIEGFKATDKGIKDATTPDIREDLGDAIYAFSDMPEVERKRFR